MDKQEYVDNIYKNIIGLEDTFEFGCKQCGNCCRNRAEPIMLTGYDLFNIAKATNLSLVEAMVKFTEGIIGADSKLPIVLLTERYDGSCKLLRKGRCMIQQDKPLVCRLYPLGRLFDGKQYSYFTQTACKGEGQRIKLKDWLNEFNIPAYDEASTLWGKLLYGATYYMQTLLKSKSGEEEAFRNSCLYAFYCSHDLDLPIEENFKRSIAYLEERYKGFKVD